MLLPPVTQCELLCDPQPCRTPAGYSKISRSAEIGPANYFPWRKSIKVINSNLVAVRGRQPRPSSAIKGWAAHYTRCQRGTVDKPQHPDHCTGPESGAERGCRKNQRLSVIFNYINVIVKTKFYSILLFPVGSAVRGEQTRFLADLYQYISMRWPWFATFLPTLIRLPKINCT